MHCQEIMACFEHIQSFCEFLNDKSVFSVSVCLCSGSQGHMRRCCRHLLKTVFRHRMQGLPQTAHTFTAHSSLQGKHLFLCSNDPLQSTNRSEAFRMELPLCAALIFLEHIVTAVFGKNLSYPLTLNSVPSLLLTSLPCNCVKINN